MDVDGLSNLPHEITDKILSRLPLRDAARTSILSSKWRYKSAMLTELSFDQRCVSMTSRRTLADVVDHVLLSRIGPISRFNLATENPHRLASGDLDRWILYLSRNSIQRLMLTLEGSCYKIPSCLFDCLDLISLALCNVLIKPPSTFEGFRNLEFLTLAEARLAQDAYDNLIIRCPRLEKLMLWDCIGFNYLNIHAPNLWYLWATGVPVDVNLESTNLTGVYIDFTDNVANEQRRAPRSSGNLTKFFVQLPRIRKLDIKTHFLKYLAVGVLPEQLPSPLQYLRFLSITLGFHNQEEILTTLCLLQSSPALRELEILALQDEQVAVEEVSYVSYENRNCQFSQLRRVRILGISAVRGELDFVQFLLSSSPVLERMTVKPSSADDILELLKGLVQFRRASANAEIILDD